MRPVFATALLTAFAAGFIFYLANFVPITSLLPVERVEIESVSLNRYGHIDGILDSKTFAGSETNQIMHLWRSQSYLYAGRYNCHEPIYRFRFYMFGVRLTEATICFHCHNIDFSTFGHFAEVTFGADTGEGKELRTYLSNLFPGHDPGPMKR